MIIDWEVEDGYAGKARPQTTTIDDSELEGLTKEEAKVLIEEYVQLDLEQTISWAYRSSYDEELNELLGIK